MECIFISGDYSISPVPGAINFTWSVPAGWTINNGQGSITMNATPGSAAQDGDISVTANNSCGTSDAGILAVTASNATPVKPTDIVGAIQICQDASEVYNTSAALNADNYTWSVPLGWSIIGGQGTTSITVIAGNFGDDGYISVNADNSCGTSGDYSIAVTVNPLPVAEAGQNDTICFGASATLIASGGSTYQWSPGATSTSIIVSPSITTSYTVTATNTFGCNDADTVTVVVSLPKADAGFDANITLGDSAKLTASGGTLYHWSTNQTTNTICVKPTTASVYTVTVTNANGCSCTDDVTVLVGSSTMPYPVNYWLKNDSIITTIPGVNKMGIGLTNPTESFDIIGNARISGNILFGGNKSISYSPAKNGISDIIIFGGLEQGPLESIDPVPMPCFSPTVTQNQFSGMIESWGKNSDDYTNVMSMGFDGANGIIDLAGTRSDGTDPGLLINYYCGKDICMNTGQNGGNVFMCTGPAGGNVSMCTFTEESNVGIGTTDPQQKLHVVGVLRLERVSPIPGNQDNALDVIITSNPLGNSNFLGSGSTSFVLRNTGLSSQGDIGFAAGTTRRNMDLIIKSTGNVGIGTNCPDATLAVNGTILSKKEITVDINGGWCDYIFSDNYKIITLSDLEKYIKKNKHLPDIPSSVEVDKNGIKLAEMNKQLLTKVEELTLYVIEQKKQIKQQQSDLEKLKKSVDTLQKK